jgi:alpha-ribazole phosphatase
MSSLPDVIHAWRHPRPQGVVGRCIGQTDVAVDPRKARRLARRIQAVARREGLPRVVCTSPLQRCRLVGRYLRRWGWRHEVHLELMEMDFGAWDGRAWADIARAEVDAWCEHLADVAPGGGETLRQVLARARHWQAPVPDCVVVAHAGWMLARRWVQTHPPDEVPLQAAQWPAAPSYQARWSLP